jgi:hypothetical protein
LLNCKTAVTIAAAKGIDSKMLTLLVLLKHAPADSPFHNERSRKLIFEYMSKQKELMDEHEIEVVVSGTAVGTDEIVLWVRAPNYEAFQAFLMEPAVMNVLSFNTMEVKVLVTLEEVKQWMTQHNDLSQSS